MDVNLAVTISDSPARLVPRKHPKRPPFDIALFQVSIKKFLRPWRHAPMVRMHRNIRRQESMLKVHGLRQPLDGILNSSLLFRVSRWEFVIEMRVFLLIESDNKNPFPRLGHAEILRVQLSLKDRESCGRKKLLEYAEKLRMSLVPKPEHILEHKKIKLKDNSQIFQHCGVVVGKIRTGVVSAAVRVA